MIDTPTAAPVLAASPASQPAAADPCVACHETRSPGVVADRTLFVMILEHRMRAFQGAYQMIPDDSHWHGWSEMQCDLSEIRSLAQEMRAAAAAHRTTRPASRKT